MMPGQRMRQANSSGMQREPSGQLRQLRPVQEIPCNRTAKMRHVNADLVRASRFERQFQ